MSPSLQGVEGVNARVGGTRRRMGAEVTGSMWRWVQHGWVLHP